MLDWEDDEVEDEEAVPAAIVFTSGTSVETAPAPPVEKNSVVLFFLFFPLLAVSDSDLDLDTVTAVVLLLYL